MRTLVFGDIHGCLRALTTAAEAAGLTEEDKLIFLGDYVDRGPDSRGVIDWVLERRRHQEVIALRGNHEVMMLQARTGGMHTSHWFPCGGDATVASYGAEGEEGWRQAVPEAHWDFLDHTLPWHETEHHIFAHASLDPDKDLPDQSEDGLYWIKLDQAAPHKSGKTVVCGHTVQKQGVPANLGFAICLDTGVYKDMWLTCLHLESGRYWQGNERGVRREGRLYGRPRTEDGRRRTEDGGPKAEDGGPKAEDGGQRTED